MAINLAAVAASLDRDAVQVVIRGVAYMGWFDVDIDNDILTPADAFAISGTIPKPKPTTQEVRAGAPAQAFEDFRRGAECDVLIGNDPQMRGVIDDVEMQEDRQTARIRLQGRDKGAYLVDSETKPVMAAQYTIKTLAEALIDPAWRIGKVILSNEDNRKLLLGKKDKRKPSARSSAIKLATRRRTKVDPGTAVYDVLDKHCRRLGLTWWLTAQGDLFIGRPNYDQEAAYHFYCYEPGRDSKKNNIESWRVRGSTGDDYSEVRVNGQGFPVTAEAFETAKQRPQFTATASNPDLVERGITRKLIIADHDILSNEEAQAHADWEVGIRRLKAETIEVTVEGWRQGDRLYAVDTLASVKIEEAAIDDTYYVTGRRFREDRGKRRTVLTLHRKGVWLA